MYTMVLILSFIFWSLLLVICKYFGVHKNFVLIETYFISSNKMTY